MEIILDEEVIVNVLSILKRQHNDRHRHTISIGLIGSGGFDTVYSIMTNSVEEAKEVFKRFNKALTLPFEDFIKFCEDNNIEEIDDYE